VSLIQALLHQQPLHTAAQNRGAQEHSPGIPPQGHSRQDSLMSIELATAKASNTTAVAAHHLAAREYLSFRLGAEEYGIDILRVQEIRGYEAPTRIANSAEFIKGVINLRGVIVPIVDMRIRFGLADVAYGPTTVTIVLNIGGRTVGMVVDSVSDVIELDSSQVKAAPEFNGAVDSSCITGLGTVTTGDTERMLILMDIEQLMRSPEMGLMDEIH
jgi:purine-binding chemotaxis protein CheW